MNLTRQQVLDYVYPALVAQGGPSRSPNGLCLYNGPEGTHCAIGWLIGSHTAVEGSSVCDLAMTVLFPWLLADLQFYRQLQAAHDTASDRRDSDYNWVQALEPNFNRLASHFNLDFPPTVGVPADGP